MNSANKKIPAKTGITFMAVQMVEHHERSRGGVEWCRGQDLNLHELSPTTTSR